MTLASVHKDQALPKPKRPRPPPAAPKLDAKPDRVSKAEQVLQGPPPKLAPSPLPLKVFVLLLAVGLIGTSLIGVYIALTNRVLQKTAAIVLAAGVVARMILLFV